MPAAGVLMLDARKDPQTVTADGQRVERLIEGVVVRNAVTHEDDRGELSEIFNPAWGVTSEPLVYVYQSMIRPGKLKGWTPGRPDFPLLRLLKVGAVRFARGFADLQDDQ